MQKYLDSAQPITLVGTSFNTKDKKLVIDAIHKNLTDLLFAHPPLGSDSTALS